MSTGPKNERKRARMAAVISAVAVVSVGLWFGAVASAHRDEQAQAKLKLDLSAQRFVAHGDHVVARGPVVARVVRPDGTRETIRKRVHLRVKTPHRCHILKLHLAPLFLNLLGLEVRTSTIDVRITGDPRRTLGHIFCRLSRGLTLNRHRLAKRSAHSLNHRLHHRRLRFLSFKAPLRVQQSTGTPTNRGASVPPPSPDSCEVLDLLLGPLHLDLLGLIVDLHGERGKDPVRVHVTADPNGGQLGSLLCPGPSP